MPVMGETFHIICLLWVFVNVCEPLMFGEVSSPRYPQPYSGNLNEQWDLEVPMGYKIQLTFNHLDIEASPNCLNNSVMVIFDEKIQGKFCGQNSTDRFHPGDKSVLAHGNRLKVIFQTEDTKRNSHLGFTAFFQAVDVDECKDPDNKCTQLCNNYIGGYRCFCRPGYFLNLDQHTCTVVDCKIPKLPDMAELTVKEPLTTFQEQITLKCSSQYYQMTGNDNFSCDASGNWVSESGQKLSEDSRMCEPVCGMNSEVLFGGRVYGGKPAKLGQIPWKLLHRSNPRGQAFLISDQWALTAAHLVDEHENQTMQFTGGMIDETDQRSVTLITEKIIIHPNYENIGKYGHEINFDNDIALIKMSQQVKLGPNIRPLCLPKKSDGTVLEGMKGTISGFGGIKQETKSNLLLHGRVEEYSLEKCLSYDLPVTDNMFCAGNENEQIDSCQGDGGGALFFPTLGTASLDQRYEVRGIVSWGPSVCGHKSFKGYYTKVRNYLDWIRETMARN
ncbi:complement C1s subcomponent-like [Triplophysa dalaica]|uniref:complement C1s subcomponent-like n=1 Tax=Triplophysa dalaica TaxID=1582913 RepID=UPI0024DFC289|nr:complement C1s subcomponent-like [Triplophysa dalaica]